ncbi:MAG: type II toxin-antitoxin system HicB family antitoxin [Methylocystis sp.]
MIQYRLELSPDDNDTVLVTSPDLPGLVTYGEDRTSALKNAIDAAETLIASMMADGDDIPLPEYGSDVQGEFVALPLQDELKLRLYVALRQANMTRADLQRRLGWSRESVDRLFRLDHASRLSQLEDAFAALGKRVGATVSDACSAAA